MILYFFILRPMSFTFVVLNVMSRQVFHGLPCNFDRQSWSLEKESCVLWFKLSTHYLVDWNCVRIRIRISTGLISHLGQTIRSKSHIEWKLYLMDWRNIHGPKKVNSFDWCLYPSSGMIRTKMLLYLAVVCVIKKW